MRRKIFVLAIVLAMLLPSLMVISPVQAADTGEVCGIDNVTYDSADAAEAAGVDVSYNFACVDPSSETGLYEDESDINFAGMLIEVGSTDVPTNLIIRRNSDKKDFTVNVDADTILGQRRDQATKLSDWIPGDQIRVIGKLNENTTTVTATVLVNLSIVIRTNQGVNGWITAIDKDAKTITYQWMNKEHVFAYDDNTRFVSGLKNPASVDDLKIGDRIRGRLLVRSGENPLAKIVIVLRRGRNLFMKIRTFTPRGTIVRLDSATIPTTMQIRIDKTPGLRANDVNNLIGTEGTLVTVNITEDTRLVRKYFGQVTLDEFSVGDKVMVVGRVNDDDTVDAKLVKDNSIWKTSTRGHAGVVTEVNAENNYLMMDWTPIKRLTRKQLKNKLKAANTEVIAQSLSNTSLKDRLKTRLAQLKTRVKAITGVKINRFTRNIKYKKVVINRIRHKNLKIGDLITRGKTRSVKVEVNDDTKIIVGTNTNGSLSDIQVGDRLRVRGVRQAGSPITVIADTIVVVNSLPEISEPLDTDLDDVNEIVSEITTDDSVNAIVSDTDSDTEEEINSDDTTAAEEGDAETDNSGDNSETATTSANSAE